MKHTPGPWKITKYSADKTYCEIYSLNGELNEPVAVIPADDVTTKGMREVKANAKLIAAIPVLVEALRELVVAQDTWEEMEDCGVAVLREEARNRLLRARDDAGSALTKAGL